MSDPSSSPEDPSSSASGSSFTGGPLGASSSFSPASDGGSSTGPASFLVSDSSLSFPGNKNCPPAQGGSVVEGSGAVRAATGLALLSNQVYFSGRAFNSSFSTRLEFNNLDTGGTGGFGGAWNNTATDSLFPVAYGTRVYYYISSNRIVYFDWDSGLGAYTALSLENYSLQRTSITDWGYRLRTPDGEVRTFDADGYLTGIKGPAGNAYDMVYEGFNLKTVTIHGAGGLTTKYTYTWDTYSKISEIVYSLNNQPVERLTYRYEDSLGTRYPMPAVIKKWINSAAAGVTPDWGTTPVMAERFTYAGMMVQHVIPPAEYKQMENNGINPETATDPQIQAYAETEYEYYGTNQVKTMWTHGRAYKYSFVYTQNPAGQPTVINGWAAKTAVTYPDTSVRTYYMNWASQVLLDMRYDPTTTPARTWYTLFQNYDSVSGQINLAADADAINVSTFSESNSLLVSLYSSQGLVTRYAYDSNRNLISIGVANGATTAPSALIKTEAFTYEARSSGTTGSIFLPKTHVVYPTTDGLNAITTSYDYLPTTGYTYTQRKTTLPVVSTAENGRGGIAPTRFENYDANGFLTSTVDEAGVTTQYAYDPYTGAMTQMIQDPGAIPAHLNLTTDYTVDFWGRTTLELGPKHTVDLNGTATEIRTAQWTQYKDREGEVRSFAGYQTTATSPVSQIVGPVTISLPNIAPPKNPALPAPPWYVTSAPQVDYTGWRQSRTIDATFASTGIPAPTAVFDQSTWVRLNIGLIDTTGKKKEEWAYFRIPAAPAAATPPNTNYGIQSTDFGRKFFAYDTAGRLNQTTCAGGTIDKTTYNALGMSLQEEIGTSHGLNITRSNEYDDRGNLNKVTLPVDTIESHNRITVVAYDWRSRLSQVQANVEKTFGGAEWTLFETYVYDNRDLLMETTNYHTSVSPATRTGYRTVAWDVLGRAYRQQVYAVSWTTGGTSYAQVSNRYYTATGRIARDAPAGSTLFTATTYDAVGRQSKVFQAAGSITAGADPAVVSGSVVMEQQEYTWDGASNLIQTISRARFDNAVGNGELQNASTEPKARVSYTTAYPDALNRSLAMVDYGTNGGTAPARPGAVPARSETVLVTSNLYAASGTPWKQTDPIGQITERVFDASDRLITLIEDSGGTPSRTSRYEYTDDGWLTYLKCDNATTGQQVTQWFYGVKSDEGSQLNSNRLPLFKYYPDTSSPTDRVYFGYNRQQQVVAQQDQAGTNHVYGYDKFGRLVTDTATAVGTNIDNTVRQLMTGYNERGLLDRKLSYSQTFAAVNDVYFLYNEFNQLITEYQEHNNFVNTSTSKKVQYTYANGSANTVRPTGMIYPNGNTVTWEYSSTVSAAISRPDQVKESTTVLSSFRFLGLNKQVGLKYDAASNTQLTYENGSTGEAGDKYSGLDRFGRIVETIWLDNNFVKRVNSKYGRRRNGGINWRRDEYAHSLSPGVTDQDSAYLYDGLQQVTNYLRGNLTTAAGESWSLNPLAASQTIAYDPMGNWNTLSTFTPSLSQTRTHNKANEIATIVGPTGVPTPAFDLVGNMTTAPSGSNWTTSIACRWDAWSRLVQADSLVYVYDAIGRRVKNGTIDIYYNALWRAVEERSTTSVTAQYTWSPFDRWTLMRRKRSTIGTLDQSRWCLSDDLNPVAVTDDGGNLLARFSYDAFGITSFLSAAYQFTAFNSSDWNFLFHGELLDAETYWYNYGYRFYNPRLGRWLSRDPIDEKGGLNLYSFVGNQSVNKIDLLGLACKGYFRVDHGVHDYGAEDQATSGLTSGSGFEVSFIQSPAGNCCCDSISISQAINRNHMLSDSHIDVSNEATALNRKTPGGTPAPSYKGGGGKDGSIEPNSYVDAPWDDPLKGKLTFEVCAYCVEKSGTRTQIGCATFDFDLATGRGSPKSGLSYSGPSSPFIMSPGPQGKIFTDALTLWGKEGGSLVVK